MIYPSLKVAIPYYDLDVLKFTVLSFHGEVNHRRVKREVRKYCKRAFNRTVDLDFIKHDCQYFTPNDAILEQNIKTFHEIITKEHNEIQNEENTIK